MSLLSKRNPVTTGKNKFVMFGITPGRGESGRPTAYDYAIYGFSEANSRFGARNYNDRYICGDALRASTEEGVRIGVRRVYGEAIGG